MPSLILEDFRGGADFVNSESQLPANRSPDPLNATVDQLGMLGKRGGCASLISGLAGSLCVYVFYSKTLDKYFVQNGVTLKKYSNAFVFEANVFALPTADKIAMVDFNSTSGAKAVFVHKTGGIYDSPDGVTWTSRNVTVKGTTIAVWQNKLWVGGDTSNFPRVWWSNAGTSATWTTATDFVDVREKDVTVITCLYEAAGALLVFKEDSTYRINNDQTGQFVMIDRAHGASEHESVASIEGLFGCANHQGFYTTDGNSALIRRSDPVAPLFTYAVGNTNLVVNVLRDRFIVSTPADVMVMEWDPSAGLDPQNRGGWWLHSPGGNRSIQSCAGQVGDKLVCLFDNNGSIREVYSFGDRALGSDFAGVIPFRYVLPWQRFGSDKVRIRRMIIEGRAPASGTSTIDAYLRRDYDATEDAVRSFSLVPTGSHILATAESHSLGVCRDFSIRFANSSSANLQKIVGGVSVYVPPVAIARVRLDFISLRRA